MWSALVENQYLESQDTVPQMINAYQDKVGSTLNSMKIKKIMAEDSLKIANFIDDVNINQLICLEISK